MLNYNNMKISHNKKEELARKARNRRLDRDRARLLKIKKDLIPINIILKNIEPLKRSEDK